MDEKRERHRETAEETVGRITPISQRAEPNKVEVMPGTVSVLVRQVRELRAEVDGLRADVEGLRRLLGQIADEHHDTSLDVDMLKDKVGGE